MVFILLETHTAKYLKPPVILGRRHRSPGMWNAHTYSCGRAESPSPVPDPKRPPSDRRSTDGGGTTLPSLNLLPGTTVVSRTDPVPALSSFMVQQWTVLSQDRNVCHSAMFVTLRKHYQFLRAGDLSFHISVPFTWNLPEQRTPHTTGRQTMFLSF